MDFDCTELLNSHSYLQQKMNLTSDTKDNPLYEKELFLIPRFTVVGFPIQNSQKTSYYYIELQILEAYCCDLDFDMEKSGGLLSDVMFQYDLNYSNIKQANGQIMISKSIKWTILSALYLELLENDKSNQYINVPYYHLMMKSYKIILPAAAINKDSVNILNYSFNNKEPTNLKAIRHINNKHNYGSLNFYFNNNPQYQLQIKPKIFTTTNFNLEVKNPIILTTNFADKIYSVFSKNVIKNLIIGGKSRLDEVFAFSGNNINTINIVPIKIKHYLVSHFPKIENWNDDKKEEILHKILVFNNNFDLQQNTSLNINEENSKFYQNNKIPAFLFRDNNFKDDIVEYYLKFNSNIYDNITNKIVLNDEVLPNQFVLPWFESFHFNISIPFNFQTFFNYDVTLKFIEESKEAIIGGLNNAIAIQKLTKNSNENWITTTNFSLTYDEILKFYSSNNFSFVNYQHLNHQTKV